MNATMRAKMEVRTVTQDISTCADGNPGAVRFETLHLVAVCGSFGDNGESEDNSFARWTPTATLDMTITNPELFGKTKEGQKFYLDFTPAS
jgi:hypothetical protein